MGGESMSERQRANSQRGKVVSERERGEAYTPVRVFTIATYHPGLGGASERG